MSCKHKFVFKGNNSFLRENGRYSFTYTSIDEFFCEKCLEYKSVKMEESFPDYQIPDMLPDWAKCITKKI